MNFHLATEGKSVEIQLELLSEGEINLKAWDDDQKRTVYINRKIRPQSKLAWRKIQLKLPDSPEILSVDIVATKSFEVRNVQLKSLDFKGVWVNEKEQAFIRFARWFARQASYLPEGKYRSKDNTIEYVDRIENEFGETLLTPARINRYTGRIQVAAEMFQNFTVPMRVFILLHERAHHVLNTRVEEQADYWALKKYLGLGYPKLEAIYAINMGITNGDQIMEANVMRYLRTKKIKEQTDHI